MQPKRWIHQAADQHPGDPIVLAHALRRWALADPHRYLLIYGTPVPGYHAPPEATAIASEILGVLLDAYAGSAVEPSATTFVAHVAEHRDWAPDRPVSSAILHRAMTFWTRMHGLLSLEVAGHFTGMDFDRELFFTAEVEELVR